jgi:hypothetical protein
MVSTAWQWCCGQTRGKLSCSQARLKGVGHGSLLSDATPARQFTVPLLMQVTLSTVFPCRPRPRADPHCGPTGPCHLVSQKGGQGTRDGVKQLSTAGRVWVRSSVHLGKA